MAENKPTAEIVTEELRESIRKNMPGLIGEELMRLLRKAEETAEANARLEETNQQLTTQNRQLAEQNRDYQSKAGDVTRRAENVKEREEAVHQRELKQDLLQLRVDMTEQKLALGVDLFKTVFANRALRESVTTSEYGSQTVPGQYGQQQLPTSATRTETREAKES